MLIIMVIIMMIIIIVILPEARPYPVTVPPPDFNFNKTEYSFFSLRLVLAIESFFIANNIAVISSRRLLTCNAVTPPLKSNTKTFFLIVGTVVAAIVVLVVVEVGVGGGVVVVISVFMFISLLILLLGAIPASIEPLYLLNLSLMLVMEI